MENITDNPWGRFWYKVAFRFPKLWKLRNMMVFGRINPNTKTEWERIWKRVPPDALVENYPNLFAEIISKIETTDRVLDIGCGNGVLLMQIKKAIPNIARLAGVDIAHAAIEYLKQNGIEGRQATLPEIPYSSREFNTFISTETIEHLSNPEKTVRKVAELGAEKIIFSVPNYMPPYFTAAHVQGWTKQSFEKFLRTHLPGFKLISSEIIQEKGHQMTESNGHVLVHMEKV